MRGAVVRFAVVGVVNTGVYYGVYLLLRALMPYVVATVAALAVAMVGSFFLSCYWTFRTRPTWRKFALFPLGNVSSYAMTTLGVVVLVEWVGLDDRLAPLLAAVAALPVTFLLSRWILTNSRPGRPTDRSVEERRPSEPGGRQAGGSDTRTRRRWARAWATTSPQTTTTATTESGTKPGDR
jgi:putative flippase GtrA